MSTLITDHTFGARAIFPVIALPGFVYGFARLGNRVECPGKFSGVNIKGADHATWANGGIFRKLRAGNDEIAINGGRRSDGVILTRAAVFNAIAQVNRALISEIGAGLASCGVQRDQMTVIGAKKYAAIARVGALPIGDAAMLVKMAWPVMSRLRIELPNFLTGRGVERNDTICRRRKIKPIFDDKWSGFEMVECDDEWCCAAPAALRQCDTPTRFSAD